MTENVFSTNELLETIVEGMMQKKGQEIVSLNFTKIENNSWDYFVICDADSNTQVDAIAESVEDSVKKNLGLKVWHKTGKDNAQWILLDFANIVVHVFQKQYRDFYNLEDLWADATVEKFEDNKTN